MHVVSANACYTSCWCAQACILVRQSSGSGLLELAHHELESEVISIVLIIYLPIYLLLFIIYYHYYYHV